MAKKKALNPWNIISDIMTNMLGLVFIAGIVGFLAFFQRSAAILPATNADETPAPVKKTGDCKLVQQDISALTISDWELDEQNFALNNQCEAARQPEGFFYKPSSVEPGKMYERGGKNEEAERKKAVNKIFDACNDMFVIYEAYQTEINKNLNVEFALRGFATNDFKEVSKCYYPTFLKFTDNKMTSFTEFNAAYSTNFGGKEITFTEYDNNLRSDKKIIANYMCNYTYATQRAANIQKLCLSFASTGYYSNEPNGSNKQTREQKAIQFFQKHVSLEAGVLNEGEPKGAGDGKRVDIIIRYTPKIVSVDLPVDLSADLPTDIDANETK